MNRHEGKKGIPHPPTYLYTCTTALRIEGGGFVCEAGSVLGAPPLNSRVGAVRSSLWHCDATDDPRLPTNSKCQRQTCRESIFSPVVVVVFTCLLALLLAMSNDLTISLRTALHSFASH